MNYRINHSGTPGYNWAAEYEASLPNRADAEAHIKPILSGLTTVNVNYYAKVGPHIKTPYDLDCLVATRAPLVYALGSVPSDADNPAGSLLVELTQPTAWSSLAIKAVIYECPNAAVSFIRKEGLTSDQYEAIIDGLEARPQDIPITFFHFAQGLMSSGRLDFNTEGGYRVATSLFIYERVRRNECHSVGFIRHNTLSEATLLRLAKEPDLPYHWVGYLGAGDIPLPESFWQALYNQKTHKTDPAWQLVTPEVAAQWPGYQESLYFRTRLHLEAGRPMKQPFYPLVAKATPTELWQIKAHSDRDKPDCSRDCDGHHCNRWAEWRKRQATYRLLKEGLVQTDEDLAGLVSEIRSTRPDLEPLWANHPALGPKTLDVYVWSLIISRDQWKTAHNNFLVHPRLRQPYSVYKLFSQSGPQSRKFLLDKMTKEELTFALRNELPEISKYDLVDELERRCPGQYDPKPPRGPTRQAAKLRAAQPEKVWPPVKDILKALKTRSMTQVAAALGVSDNAVRKHLQREGINLKTLPRIRRRK